GYYDLGTPYSATDWSLSQLDVPADVLARIEHHYYGAGHMMYTRETDLRRLKANLTDWLAVALSTNIESSMRLRATAPSGRGQRLPTVHRQDDFPSVMRCVDDLGDDGGKVFLEPQP